jgi:ActR/RegA family two-component response regulator
MNVIPLPARRRGGGITASDRQCAARFVFSRPGWHLADRLHPQFGRCLEVCFEPPNFSPSLRWRLIRSHACIFVEGTDGARNTGPHGSVHEALLVIWEDAERIVARLQPKPTLLLCGIDPLAVGDLQDIAAMAGFEALVVPEDAMALAVAAQVHPAAAVVDLQLYPAGADGRDIIRLLRRARPDLPVLALTIHAPTAPEADLHGLGGPTHRERRPHDADRVLHWLLGVYEAHGDGLRGVPLQDDGPA